ncbi:T5orf172 domain-containing protein [Paenibacillus sophorae]|uniref:T5orf172 domain-containing protein n=2 Tax=Paenibacillus sophorae TaxID=1333845 RepID=A0A1H8LZJ7_9BACL|nr:GIY-YIG nuclease family protein [Paenibacillus sophorae]SEO10440.1 T5orf172 domain-containing protein [Paenibacillus sophorae]
MFRKFKEFLQLNKSLEEKQRQLLEKEQQVNALEQKIANLDQFIEDAISPLRQAIEEKGVQIIQDANQEAASIINESNIKAGQIVDETTSGVSELLMKKEQLTEDVSRLETQMLKVTKELTNYQKTAKKHKAEILGIKNLIEHFPEAVNHSMIEAHLHNLEQSSNEDGVLETIVHLHLHHKDSKALRSEMNANNKDIRNLLTAYQTRYTTKANTTIYELMVIGLQAELQNILYTLSYSNLDKAIENSKLLIEKYLKIAANGNANILPTITRFLSELEPLFEIAIRIEYKYYVQKDLEKEEQRKIREIMRQEAEEKRILEEERKKLEKEEEKYHQEIAKNIELLQTETDVDKIAALEARLKELEEQCHKLEETKEEIIKRANGKAGYVYVISNLGSFGDNMFKVGMTRRLNPMDRVDELGDASVPFRFDVHALMFSDDAVGLEQKLHEILEAQRVNKINLRKEFFYATVQELQDIVQEIDPTIEFIQTMAAMEYRQSQSIGTSEIELEPVFS